MTLKERITEDMKAAMRAKETARLSTIRLLLAAMKQREVDERITLTDADVLSIIDKMIKQRKDSVEQFEKGARQELADKEKAEIEVIEAYLPQSASQEEIEQAVSDAIAETGATSMKEMGKVMKAAQAQLASKNADGRTVSEIVKSKLGG